MGSYREPLKLAKTINRLRGNELPVSAIEPRGRSDLAGAFKTYARVVWDGRR